MQQYFMPIYTTVVGAVIGFLAAWVKSLVSRRNETKKKGDSDMEAIKEGVAILLRDRIESYYDRYMGQDYISTNEWAEIDKTHKVYNKLGGNSTGDRLYEELRKKHLEV